MHSQLGQGELTLAAKVKHKHIVESFLLWVKSGKIKILKPTKATIIRNKQSGF